METHLQVVFIPGVAGNPAYDVTEMTSGDISRWYMKVFRGPYEPILLAVGGGIPKVGVGIGWASHIPLSGKLSQVC